jgi:uncharacterized protein YndB with AHSA1/START domain
MTTASLPETTAPSIEAFLIKKETLIAAPPEIIFQTILDGVGPLESMKLKIEPFRGGRWFRDLGNNTGHLWGHVQVIKPPLLLELVGPMMMSYAVASHIQYRLTPEGTSTRLTLTHQAIGLIQPDHKTGLTDGWQKTVDAIRVAAEKKGG